MEDNERLSRLIKSRLVRHGYHVTIAPDGKIGLKLYDSAPYDVVIVDHKMPVYTGLDVIRILSSRASKEEKGDSEGAIADGEQESDLPPMIMVTGAGNEDLAVEAIKLGVSDYIIKDVNGKYLDLLPSVIDKVYGRFLLNEEKKRAERNLKRADNVKTAILSGISEQVLYQDKNMNILWVNSALGKAMAEEKEITPKKLVGHKCYKILNDNDDVCIDCPVIKTYETLAPQEAEVFVHYEKQEAGAKGEGQKKKVIKNPTKGRIWVVHAHPVLDEGGEIEGIVVFRRETTRERLSERQLLATKEMFRLLSENTKDIIYRYQFSPTEGFVYVSPAVSEITGYTPDEFYNDPSLLITIVHPNDRHIMERHSAEPVAIRWIRKDGIEKLIKQKITPIFDENEKLVAIEGTAWDIT